MKTGFPVVVLLAAFCLVSEAVIVQEGKYSFSLESVKKLKDIMDMDTTAVQNTRLPTTGAVVVCENPDLPVEFQPLCQSKEARSSFLRLALVANHMDACEICAFAACTGC